MFKKDWVLGNGLQDWDTESLVEKKIYMVKED
jgi:hypothetical protein